MAWTLRWTCRLCQRTQMFLVRSSVPDKIKCEACHELVEP